MNNSKQGSKISEQDILKVFDAAEEPFLTSSEIADELPVSRQAVNYRLEQMREKDLVGKKKTGARSVGWWAQVGPRLSDEARAHADAADLDAAISHEDLKAELGIE